MIVTMEDINKRTKKPISNVDKSQFNINEMDMYTDKNVFVINNAIHMINHWQEFNEDTNIAFNKALIVFDEICKNCNDSQVRTTCDFLVENVDKVRDSGELLRSIKYHNSRTIKSKITKINNTIGSISDSLSDSINDIKSKINQPQTLLPKVSVAKESTIEECYNRLEERAKVIKECDRIISNYNTISKRFNIDKLVSEVTFDNDMYLCINEICSYIDTYDSSFKAKYNTALETVFYAFNKHHMNYPKNKIVEAATDYFIFNSQITESEISDIKDIELTTSIFDNTDFDGLRFIFNEKKCKNESTQLSADDYGVNFKVVDENSITSKVKEWSKGNPEEHKHDEVKQMMDDFRKRCAKDPDNKNLVSNLKAVITKIFTKTPDQIVNELPSLMIIIRSSFVIGSTAINPVLGLVAFITNSIIKITLERKQIEKIINTYKKELDSVKSKLDKAKDQNSKSRLEAYKKELESDLEKLKEYERNLYSEEENDERDMASYDFDDDFDFDFDDDDFGFDESQLINLSTVMVLSELVNSINEGLIDTNIDGIVYDNVFKLDSNAIDTLTDYSITVPSIINRNNLCEAFTQYRDQLRSSYNSSIDKYIKIDCLNTNIDKLKESTTVYNIDTDAKSLICSLKALDELVNNNNTNQDCVLEMTFTNTLKLALTRLKNTAMKLSDKEKQISNSIDVSINNVSKGLEAAVANDNREAIIKGRILPSASKTIKIALASGAAWAVNPALAVIGAIGAFACSAKLKAKERQLVLDDIEIELKMCERYLRLAEEKNDMKAIRQIEITQRNLQRQQQRIKYKMKVTYKQDVPNVAGSDD